MAPRPDISIALIAYNHEKFIKDTFHGIAMQEFSGTIEVVIGDDCSLDRTRELATEFAAQHPNVKLLFHANNGGMVHNWTTTIDACTGRYIALCEGDDYWTDPCKLQRQFDLMEQHPEHSMCWHPVDVVEEGVQRAYPYALGEKVSDVHDIIRSHFIPTCSLLFRNGLIREWPQWIGRVMSMDISLELILAMRGTGIRIDNVMGAYRQHPNGISKSAKTVRYGRIRLLYLLKNFNNYSNGAYDKTIRDVIAEISGRELRIILASTESDMLLHVEFLKYRLYGINACSFQAIRNELYIYAFPKLYQRLKR
jgi:glycosyltransferase involved in cell wall biosynthesis